ncbi:unnamed protein product, partial [marine sediment metagenome]
QEFRGWNSVKWKTQAFKKIEKEISSLVEGALEKKEEANA